MTDSWSRKHSTHWTGGVRLVVEQMGHRFYATAAPPGDHATRGAQHYDTADLAKTMSNEAVQRASDHTCTDACEPWQRDIDGSNNQS